MKLQIENKKVLLDSIKCLAQTIVLVATIVLTSCMFSRTLKVNDKNVYEETYKAEKSQNSVSSDLK